MPICAGSKDYTIRKVIIDHFQQLGPCLPLLCTPLHVDVPVAFYNGQAQEKQAAEESFETLYWRMRSLFKRTFFLLLFVNIQGNGASTVSLLVVALTIISSGSLNGQAVTAGNAQV